MKLKNKLFTMLGLSFAFVFGFITISNLKIDAVKFTLSDGSESNITYNEGQLLAPSSSSYMTTYRIIYYNNYYAIINSSNSSVSMYNNCTYDPSVATLTCTKMVTNSYPNTTTSPYIFTDNYNFIVDVDKLIAVSSISSYPNTDYFIVPGYQEGYNAGIGDNQETIYNNGYNAGYNAGETAGYQNGYNVGKEDGYEDGYVQGVYDGYEDGKVDGTEEGYNTGYSAGQTAGLATGYQNGYNVGYGEGETVGYQNGYNVGYGEGETVGYQNGYNVGYGDAENFGLIISSCDVTRLVNNSSYNCASNVDVVNGFVSFSDLRSYLDNNSLIDGRYNIDLHLENYLEPNLPLSFNFYSSTGVYVYFYDGDTLLYTLDIEDYSLDRLDYIILSNYGLTTSYNRIIFSNANYDYSIASFGIISQYSYDTGYDNGYVDGTDSKNNLPGVIGAVISTPINMLSDIFDFEFLGVNLSSFIFSLLSLLVVIWLVKFFF